MSWSATIAAESEETWTRAATFSGRAIHMFDPTVPLPDGASVVGFGWPRLGEDPLPAVRALFADPTLPRVEALCLGVFETEWDAPGYGAQVQQFLVDQRARLLNLRGLFLGDVTEEDFQPSWIQIPDFGPVLEAFPRLSLLRTRGARQFDPPTHPTLKALQLQFALGDEALAALAASNLPQLEHLELWLGDDEYGGGAAVESLLPILSGKLFPRLRYLGLRNADRADAIAAVVAEAPVVSRLHALDLSLGTLGDEGAEALLASSNIQKLQRLDVHHNYINDDLRTRLQRLGIPQVDVRPMSKVDDDPENRFVAIGE